MFQSMRYVYEVYRQMSFSKAAQNMYISQPSLSAAVKRVEERIGAPIFDRSTNPIRLTEIGREYIRAAERIMDIESGFEAYVQDMTQLKSGSLSLGGTHFFISYVIPPLISGFSEKYPQIQVNLVEGSTPELAEKLESGGIELLLDYGLHHEGIFGKKVLQEEHLLIAVPAHYACNERVRGCALTAADVRAGRHLNARMAPAPLSAFRDEPFLLLREGNDTRERALRLCRAAQFEPMLRLELEQQITAYNLTCHGMGISFIGDSLIRNVPDAHNLLFYRLQGPEAVRSIHVYYKKNRYVSNVVKAFLAHIEGISPKEPPDACKE